VLSTRVRPTTIISLSHWALAYVYHTMGETWCILLIRFQQLRLVCELWLLDHTNIKCQLTPTDRAMPSCPIAHHVEHKAGRWLWSTGDGSRRRLMTALSYIVSRCCQHCQSFEHVHGRGRYIIDSRPPSQVWSTKLDHFAKAIEPHGKNWSHEPNPTPLGMICHP